MSDADRRARIYEALVGLSARWPKEILSKERSKLYVDGLVDLPPELVELAALDLAFTSDFFPSPAALRRRSAEIAARRAGIPAADEAWAEVVDELARTARFYRSETYFSDVEPTNYAPRFSHPIIFETVKALGGWVELARSDSRESWRARFLDFYASRLNRTLESIFRPPAVRAFLAGGEIPKSAPLLEALVARLSDPKRDGRAKGERSDVAANEPEKSLEPAAPQA